MFTQLTGNIPRTLFEGPLKVIMLYNNVVTLIERYFHVLHFNKQDNVIT